MVFFRYEFGSIYNMRTIDVFYMSAIPQETTALPLPWSMIDTLWYPSQCYRRIS